MDIDEAAIDLGRDLIVGEHGLADATVELGRFLGRPDEGIRDLVGAADENPGAALLPQEQLDQSFQVAEIERRLRRGVGKDLGVVPETDPVRTRQGDGDGRFL